MTSRLQDTVVMCSFQCLYHHLFFQKKAAFFPKMAIGWSSEVSNREFKIAWPV